MSKIGSGASHHPETLRGGPASKAPETIPGDTLDEERRPE
jgi:hypothetical protein